MRSDLLHVVGVYSNPVRFASRLRLAREWIQHMKESGVRLTFVQHAYAERDFDFDESDLLMHGVNLISVRGGPTQELWLKEALAMKGIASTPADAQNICWEDADVRHVDPNWAAETVYMLQHYRVGQTWTHSVDLGPKGQIMRNEWGNDVDRSFCAAWLAGDVDVPHDGYGPPPRDLLMNKGEKDWRQHYGYSWAIRRDALNGIGRLLDWMVTGSADYHMALGFAGKLDAVTDRELADGNEKPLSPGYLRRLREFAAKCEEHIKQDIGCVEGSLLHGFHGHKKLRGYISRKDILIQSGFDPDKDITYDMNGIPTLCTDNRILRDGLRRYFRARDEDSTHLF